MYRVVIARDISIGIKADAGADESSATPPRSTQGSTSRVRENDKTRKQISPLHIIPGPPTHKPTHTPPICIEAPPPFEIELTPLKTSAPAPLIASPALIKGNPNDSFLVIFPGVFPFGDEGIEIGIRGDVGVIGDLGSRALPLLLVVEIEDDVEVDLNDELRGTSAEGDIGEFGTVSVLPSQSFDDEGVTVSELTEDLRVVNVEGKASVRESGRGFAARGVDAPDWEGVVISPALVFLEIPGAVPLEARTSSELTLSLLLVFVFCFRTTDRVAALFGCKHELEVFGLAPGDDFGDTPGEVRGELRGDEPADDDREPVGERRGEGSGNNSFSSSSAIGEALRGRRCAEGEETSGEDPDSERSESAERSRSCLLTVVERLKGDPDRVPSPSMPTPADIESCDRRRLSTSSTVIANVGGGIRASKAPGANAVFCTPPLVPEVLVESKLALRRRLAPLVNFSCHVGPSFRHWSVMGTQSGQQARSGMV